jgi:hypothetical protein
MRVEDLKVGMVVRLNYNGDEMLAWVMESRSSGKCISSERYWSPIESFNENLRNSECVITAVYDLCRYNRLAYKLSTDDRQLLWEGNKVKELTVAEIEKLLGYPVMIVKES